MSRGITEMNYGRLVKIISEDILKTAPVGSSAKSVSGPYMDFHFDILRRSEGENGQWVEIAIAHRGVQNGDSMADPDMELRVYFHPLMNTVEPLTFQNDYAGVYQRVWEDENRYRPISASI